MLISVLIVFIIIWSRFKNNSKVMTVLGTAVASSTTLAYYFFDWIKTEALTMLRLYWPYARARSSRARSMPVSRAHPLTPRLAPIVQVRSRLLCRVTSRNTP